MEGGGLGHLGRPLRLHPAPRRHAEARDGPERLEQVFVYVRERGGDLGRQVGEVPLARAYARRLEVDESRPRIGAEDVAVEVWTAVQGPAVEAEGCNFLDQHPVRFLEKEPVGRRQRGRRSGVGQYGADVVEVGSERRELPGVVGERVV